MYELYQEESREVEGSGVSALPSWWVVRMWASVPGFGLVNAIQRQPCPYERIFIDWSLAWECAKSQRVQKMGQSGLLAVD